MQNKLKSFQSLGTADVYNSVQMNQKWTTTSLQPKLFTRFQQFKSVLDL